MRDITSVFLGISSPVSLIVEQIEAAGWLIKKVKFDKKSGLFVASAKNANGEEISKSGITDATALGNVLVTALRRNHIRSTAQWRLSSPRFSKWDHAFVDRLPEIAEAYRQAPVYDPKAAQAFSELGEDSVSRASEIKKYLHVEPTADPAPYESAQKMFDDVHKNRHLSVSTSHLEHPVFSSDQHLAFRTVHDVMGHTASGGDWSWNGVNKACAMHGPLLSENAQRALFSERIGHEAYKHHFHGFGPKKIALLNKHFDASDDIHAVHPSQTSVPVALPSARIAASAFTDPNAGWQSGVAPLGVNAYLHHGDPLEAQESLDNAKKIDTGWSEFKTGEGAPDMDRMKQAIVNAFRVVLLSPRKDLKANCQHYQDIGSVPASTTNPDTYWNTLENARQNWNVERFGEEARFAHMPYAKFLKPFENIIFQHEPSAGYPHAQEKAQQILHDWINEEQERISEEDRDKPADKQRPGTEIERRANEAVAKRLQMYIKDFQPKLDFLSAKKKDIKELAKKILAECKGSEVPKGSYQDILDLFEMYAQLALDKGKDTSMEDVHKAWEKWMRKHDPSHKSLKPFKDLSRKVQE